LQSAGDYSALTVSFDSIIWDRPWKTRFEFVKRDEQWKLTAFEDLTQRAVDDSKLSANDFVLAYLKQAGIAANLLNTTTDKDEKKRIEQYQISGAGFWKSNPIKSRLFILWLQQKTPTDWKLLETSVPSEATAKVIINFNGVKHHKTGYSLTFDIINENNHWLIKNYYNRQTQTRLETRKITSDIAAKEISNVQLNQDSAESVVRSQLKILEYASSGAGVSILSELAKKSKPLWLKSRKARASLGRMLGISANLKEPHQWILAKQGESAEKQILIVTFTTPMKLLLIKGIRFIVLKQDDIWKIKEATLFR